MGRKERGQLTVISVNASQAIRVICIATRASGSSSKAFERSRSVDPPDGAVPRLLPPDEPNACVSLESIVAVVPVSEPDCDVRLTSAERFEVGDGELFCVDDGVGTLR